MTCPITASTTVAELVDNWLHELRACGRLENTTINEYERVLRKLVVPTLGGLRLGELTTDGINAVLSELGTQSVNRQRKAKVVTGAMLNTAIEAGALASNPVRGSMSVSRPKTEARTLTLSDLEIGPFGRAGVDGQGTARPEELRRPGRHHRADARDRRAHRRGARTAMA